MFKNNFYELVWTEVVWMQNFDRPKTILSSLDEVRAEGGPANPYQAVAAELLLMKWDEKPREPDEEQIMERLFDEYLFGLFYAARRRFGNNYSFGVTPSRWKDRYFSILRSICPRRVYLGSIRDLGIFLVHEDDLNPVRIETSDGQSEKLVVNKPFLEVSATQKKTTKKAIANAYPENKNASVHDRFLEVKMFSSHVKRIVTSGSPYIYNIFLETNGQFRVR